MRRLTLAALLSALCLAPAVSHAQDKPTRQAEQKIGRILEEFNEEMRAYERELKYFQKTPEFKPLFDLRTSLVAQAGQMYRLDRAGRGSGPAVLALAREMDRTARKLDAASRGLEKRADAVSNREGRTVAARMNMHADLIVKTTEKLILMFR